MIARRGPPVWSVQIVAGAAITKAKRKAVLSQLIMLGVVKKKSAAVLTTGEKESHCLMSEFDSFLWSRS